MTSRRLRLVVLGTMASNPFAGMAWMTMQITAGLRRLGHDVVYMETTSAWPYDPVRQTKVPDSRYAVPYLGGVAERFGLGERWAYRQTFSDGAWLGPMAEEAAERLVSSDAVFNIAGATRLSEDGIPVSNLVYFGTDPVYHEISYLNGNAETRAIVDEHVAMVTYGENIGTGASPIPPLPRQRATTRQPVLTDLWVSGPPLRNTYTTVANWKQDGREVDFQGERYLWSKDVEFLKFIDVPTRTTVPIELATNLASPESLQYGGEGEPVKTRGVVDEARSLLEANRWQVVAAETFTQDPWSYRDYVQASRAEFSVARDLNVRLRSGWFSERSACYLAAGRPVITQDTGFGTVLPTGEGLFAFTTSDEAVAAINEVESDYARHSRAARAIAEEYFRAETVLRRLLADLGL